MPIWSASTIQRFSDEGEEHVSHELKCIIARIALDITLGTPDYTLPSTLLFIRRVTYRGKKLQPMPARDWHDINTVLQQSTPLWYIFNQQGRNKIRLHPIPAETITADQTNLFGSNIGTQCIVEYYSVPDGTQTIPAYIKRRLVKYYVLMMCFSQEGKGQNLKCAARMKKRFEFYLNVFKTAYSQHYVVQMNVLGYGAKKGILASPRLPYSFGEPGEF